MSLINGYQKGWALRYLREAKAELSAAQKTPYMASSLIMEAIRKAQAAVYYSLGDPTYAETIVRQATLTRRFVQDPVLRCLVEIERTVQQLMQITESDREEALKQADGIVQTASEIVKLFTGESVD